MSSSPPPPGLSVAVVGCGHGTMDEIYATVQYIREQQGQTIDVLLICGDFQANRNQGDLMTMACPLKYRTMNSFHEYYSGEKKAPVLTIFIGGNHEASTHMQELFHGGWAAENMYFMGFSGVINFGGLRIGGLSGIYDNRSFRKGHFELPPFTESTKRSVYHTREYDVWKLQQLTGKLDMFMSHDWPRGVWNHGDMNALLRKKPFLKDDMVKGRLGSPASWSLLSKLQPEHWFSAHYHVKFPAVVPHAEGKATKFLALSKCLPRQDFLQVVHFPQGDPSLPLRYDPQWLAIMRSTHAFMCTQERVPPALQIPTPSSSSSSSRFSSTQRSDFTPTEKELKEVDTLFGGDYIVPLNFSMTVTPYSEEVKDGSAFRPPSRQRVVIRNPQTTALLGKLKLRDVFYELTKPEEVVMQELVVPKNEEEIELDLD